MIVSIRIKTLVFLLLSCIYSSCSSQKSLQEKDTVVESSYLVEGQYKALYEDKLGYIYLINFRNELLKLDKDYKVLHTFSINGFGDILDLDVSNPQKLLVSYYYNIVFIDNTLSEIKRTNLEELGRWEDSVLAMSRDNNIWIFEPNTFLMSKTNELGQTLKSSNELYGEGIDIDSDLKILAHEDFVYLYNAEQVWVFDRYAQYLKSFPLANSKIMFNDNEIFYSLDKTIYSYNLEVKFTDPSQELISLDKEFVDFVIKPDIPAILILDKKGLYSKNL